MPSSPAQRRYPRAAINEPAHLTLRTREQNRRLPVSIRSISPEGVGLALKDTSQALALRATVRMDFSIAGRPFEIPGVIVWVAGAAAASGGVDVGVRFLLATVTHETRQAYASWVVELLRRLGVQAQPPRTS